MTRPGFEPMISRSEIDRANHYSIDQTSDLVNHFIYILMRQKVSLGLIKFW